jgi:hypothetical protein
VNRPRHSPLSTLLVVMAAVAVVVLGLVSPAAAAAPYCGITWGSQAKSHDAADSERVVDVRAGRHDCYDRLVVVVGGQDISFGSYDVRYVQRITEDGSGHVIPVRGGAALQVVVRAPAYDEHGNATYLPANRREVVDVGSFATFRQVAWAGSFEGQTTLGVGVRARLPFRVFTVQGTPNSDDVPRLVIDVAHRW